ncbi:uncharacterized protein FIBRA_01203 [Fibroporia radiculosa]|uniref:Uncharacterized protein n=1 Tax=Fibroporia radiculosa TaxID=599839 RepID=J4G0V0_9APHY|nr:uncharacterized protein FIBRA_01203 [Fibroporia radiculosa]CCL99188.1 predicted protein [Fibroporia radiculosa]
MNTTTLRTLTRPQIQKLARREGVRANVKTETIIRQLCAKYPSGVPPLEEEKRERRRSSRTLKTEVKKEEETGAISSISTALSRNSRGKGKAVDRPSASVSRVGHPQTRERPAEAMLEQPVAGPSTLYGQRVAPGTPTTYVPVQRELSRGATSTDIKTEEQSMHLSAVATPPQPVHAGSQVVFEAQTQPESRPIQGGLAAETDAPPRHALPVEPIVGASHKGVRVILRELATMVNTEVDFKDQLAEMEMLVDDMDKQLKWADEELEAMQNKRKLVERLYLGRLKEDHTLWDGSHAWRKENVYSLYGDDVCGIRVAPLKTLGGVPVKADKGKKRAREEDEPRREHERESRQLGGMNVPPNGALSFLPTPGGSAAPDTPTWTTLPQTPPQKRRRVAPV